MCRVGTGHVASHVLAWSARDDRQDDCPPGRLSHEEGRRCCGPSPHRGRLRDLWTAKGQRRRPAGPVHLGSPSSQRQRAAVREDRSGWSRSISRFRGWCQRGRAGRLGSHQQPTVQGSRSSPRMPNPTWCRVVLQAPMRVHATAQGHPPSGSEGPAGLTRRTEGRARVSGRGRLAALAAPEERRGRSSMSPVHARLYGGTYAPGLLTVPA